VRLVGWVAVLACLPLTCTGVLTLEYWRAESDWPAPRARKDDRGPQAHAARADQEGGDQQRGSPDVPLVVKIAPSPNAYPETDAQREAHQEKASEDRWAVWFAGASAVFAGLLVVVTGGMWIYTYKLWRTTGEAVRDEKRAVEAADLHARAVVALQLPVLSAAPDPPADRNMAPVGIDGRLPKTFAIYEATIRNDGNTSAAPIDLRVGWEVAPILPPDPNYAETRIPGSERIITARSTDRFPVYLSVNLTDAQCTLIGERRTYFWLYASIRFFDFMGTKRETGFCWQWRVQSVTGNAGNPEISETYGFSPMAWGVPPAYTRKNRPCDESDQ